MYCKPNVQNPTAKLYLSTISYAHKQVQLNVKKAVENAFWVVFGIQQSRAVAALRSFDIPFILSRYSMRALFLSPQGDIRLSPD